MGCIILQLLTWLLYGTGKIDELTKDTKSVFSKDESSYWIASWNERRGYHNIDIHPAVKKHMVQMRRDLQGSEALSELLRIVESRLLVIKLPPSATSSQEGCRANASELHTSLQSIEAACRNQYYWFSGVNIVKQASLLEIPQDQNLGVGRGNKVSSNSSISSIHNNVVLHLKPNSDDNNLDAGRE